jgi:hypothetical protein
MGQTIAQEYKPQFPKSHALLLETYSHLMKAKGEKEIAVWADRFKGLLKTFEAMKEDDAVPLHFVKTFYLDAQDVMKRVHASVETGKLTQTQGALTFGIANLANMFGAH